MKLLFITVFAVLGVSVCPGQTLADILNSQYDDNPIPTVPVEYTLPRLAAKAPFVQLFNSLLLATGHRVFHSDEYEADEYILMRIKAEDLEIEMSGSLCRYPHKTKSPIGWMPFHGKTIIFSGDNPGLFTPTEETRCFRYKDYPENSLVFPVFQGPVFRRNVGVDNLSGWRCHPIFIRMRLGSSRQGLPERPERFTVCMSREQQPL